MNRRLFVSILFILSALTAFSQEVTVSGRIVGGEGHLVRLIKYADQFSHVETTLAEVTVGKNGDFRLTTNLEQTTYAFFALDLKKNELYLVPGSSYTLEIIYDSVSGKGSVFDRSEQPLPINILTASDSLNFYISLFNRMYDNFVYRNFNVLYKRRDSRPITEFQNIVSNRLPIEKYPYLKMYADYTIASLRWVSHRLSDRNLLQQYFINQPAGYENIAYTDLFHEVMKGYFKSVLHPDTDYRKIVSLLIDSADYRDFDKLIQKDTLLKKDDRFRELVEMELLKQCYYEEGMNRENIETIYAYLAANSRFPEHRTIAVDYLKKLHRLAYGTPAPGFVLPDIMGNERTLDDYKGKFVLLNFIKTDCKICEKQLEQTDKIYRQKSPGLQVITILSGSNPDRTIELFAQNNYDWPLLLLGNKILLLESYDVRAFPAYVLINPDGTIAMAPAPMPEENLLFFINSMMKSFKTGN